MSKQQVAANTSLQSHITRAHHSCYVLCRVLHLVCDVHAIIYAYHHSTTSSTLSLSQFLNYPPSERNIDIAMGTYITLFLSISLYVSLSVPTPNTSLPLFLCVCLSLLRAVCLTLLSLFVCLSKPQYTLQCHQDWAGRASARKKLLHLQYPPNRAPNTILEFHLHLFIVHYLSTLQAVSESL
jgi:hypothetical protein